VAAGLAVVALVCELLAKWPAEPASSGMGAQIANGAKAWR